MSKAAELANLIGNINAGGGGVNRNVIINGAMNVAQRRTSASSIGNETVFILDRFLTTQGSSDGRFTMSQDSSAPSGFANSLKLDCTTADTSVAAGEFLILRQTVEAQNCQQFAKGTSDAKPFAVSFYVKGNASATYVCELLADDVSRQISQTFSVTTDWTRVELTFPADTTGVINDDNGAGLYLNIWLHAGSTYAGGTLNTTWNSLTQANRAVGISSFFDSTDRTFFITGVQLEVGQNPTEFEHEPFERTLAKCQRYFERITFADEDYTPIVCYNESTSNARGSLQYMVTKRADPTFSATSNAFIAVSTGSNGSAVSLTSDKQTVTNARVLITNSNTTLVDGGASHIQAHVSSAQISLDSEL